MRTTTLITILFIFQSTLLAESIILAPEEKRRPSPEQKELIALYAERDSVAVGLSNLSYEVCFTSRIGRASSILDQLNLKKKPKEGEPRKLGCRQDEIGCGQDPYIVLPKHRGTSGIEKERHKSFYFSRALLGVDLQGRPIDYKMNFYKSFARKHSCLQHEGIKMGCKILSNTRTRDPIVLKMREYLKKRPKFLARFNAKKACKVYESKQKYIDTLTKIQKHISSIERKVRDDVIYTTPSYGHCREMPDGTTYCE